MPTIQLTNNTTLDITASAADGTASLNRYLLHPLKFLTPSGLQSIAGTQVKDLDAEAFPLTASATGAGTFAVEGTSLGVSLGSTASVNLSTGSNAATLSTSLSLPADAANPAFVSFAIKGTLSIGPTATEGDFSFGITDAATVTLTSYTPASTTDKFTDAVGRAIQGLTIPHDLADLKSIPAGGICQIDAASTLTFTASVTYSILNDPLATVSLSQLPSLAVTATAGATIAATASHTSDHTITIAKLASGLLHLSVSLTKTDDFQTSLTASAGATATVGGHDALAFLLGKISPDSKDEVAKLKAGLPPAQAQKLSCDIKAAIDASLCSSLQASLKMALDINKSRNRLFLYEIDLNALDAAGTAALQAALTGDFTTITGTPLAGIKELDSSLTVTKTVTNSLTVHLLGIFNYRTANTFIQNSTVDYTKDTHEIVLSDEKIKVVTDNLDAEKLRQVVLKCETLTLPAAANTTDAAASINLVFFDRPASTSPSHLRQVENVLRAMGAPDAARVGSLISQGMKDYGISSLYLCLTLTPPQCRPLYINKTGQPIAWSTYASYACDALRTILSGDGDSVSDDRLKLCNADAKFWADLSKQGAAPNIGRALETLGVRQENIPVVTTDAVTFLWWAEAMAAYAQALFARQSLLEPGKQVVEDAARGFDEPWMILATWNILENPAMNSIFTCSPPAQVVSAGGS